VHLLVYELIVRKKLPSYVAQHPTEAKTSTAVRRKPETRSALLHADAILRVWILTLVS